MSTATASPYLKDAHYSEGFIDAAMADAPIEVQERVRKHPLTSDQAGYLRALAEHRHSGFLWGNRSTGERLAQALVKKGVAIQQAGGAVVPAPFVREAYVRLEQAREQARRERSEREAQENRAKHAALTDALEEEKAVLLRGLDLVFAGGKTRDDVIDRARARVESMSVSRWQGHW